MSKRILTALVVALVATGASAQESTTVEGDAARDQLKQQVEQDPNATGSGTGGRKFVNREVPENAFGSHTVTDHVTRTFIRAWNANNR